MYTDTDLQNLFETGATIEGSSIVVSEINLNSAERISKVGNYRYRPAEPESPYYTIASTYDPDDAGNNYTGATDSDVTIDGGIDDEDNPIAFTSIQTNKKLIYSLEDCFAKFRPRSGINKAMLFGNETGHFINYDNQDMMKRPRYYMGSKDDKFKYWTSMRTEASEEVGISETDGSISDAAPFVVYNQRLPINRVIVKMQTHVGTADLGPFTKDSSDEEFNDPFYDNEETVENRTVPTIWKVEYLNGSNSWQTLANVGLEFTVPRDGYVEFQYDNGVWSIGDGAFNSDTPLIDKFSNPVQISGDKYKEFQYIHGLRIVVSEMSKVGVPFELIELSPRLALDFTNITREFKINKVASDLGVSGMPVGQLLASTGSISIADYDQDLNKLNEDSVIAPFIDRNIQIKFYESIKISDNNYQYIPLKTLYAESFPEINVNERVADINLRDLYFYLESITAPQILLRDVSFSYAIAMLLDSIGFTNYVYKRIEGEPDPIIPFFFIPPDTTVAEILKRLAISTQTAMFFDEDNNFVLMSRGYLLPSPGERSTGIDMILYGSKDSYRVNESFGQSDPAQQLSNIIDIASKDNNVFNGGTIRYTTRYIQKSYQNIKQASLVDRDKTWIYKPTLLWEVAGEETTKSINSQEQTQSAYALSAIPLSADLNAEHPYVDAKGVVQNNTMDLGDGVYWLSRYNGYFYSGAEIIKFDAVEYNIGQEKRVASDLKAIVSEGSNTAYLIGDSTTANLTVGDNLVQSAPFSQTLNQRYSANLISPNTVSLTNGTTDNLYVGQNLTKLSIGNRVFANVNLVAPNMIMLDPNNGLATTDKVFIGEKVEMDSEVVDPPIFSFDFSAGKLLGDKTNSKFTSTETNKTITCEQYPGATNRQVFELLKQEITQKNLSEEQKAMVGQDANSIKVVSPGGKLADLKISSIVWTEKKRSFTVTFSRKITTNRTLNGDPLRVTAVRKMGELNTNAYITEIVDNKIFTVGVNHVRAGLMPGSLITKPSVGVLGNDSTITSIVNRTTFKVADNHNTLGSLYFNVAAIQNGQVDDNVSSPPLTITNIDQTSSTIFTMSNDALVSGGVLLNVTNRSGNVWISSNKEYQDYFSKIPFGGKLYPTGRVRIHSEPYFNAKGNRVPGRVAKSGRAQFGTTIQAHHAGLSDHWTNKDNMKGSWMGSSLIFNKKVSDVIQKDTVIQSQLSNTYSSEGTTIYVLDNKNIKVGQTVLEFDEEAGKLQPDTKVLSVPSNSEKYFVVDKAPIQQLTGDTLVFVGRTVTLENAAGWLSVPAESLAGVFVNANQYAKQTTVNGIIRNFMSNSYYSDTGTNHLMATEVGTIQSSALVMNGRSFPDQTLVKPVDFVSIVTKDLSDPDTNLANATHFGTRMRIVGTINNDNNTQNPVGATTYFAADSSGSDTTTSIQGGSGGLAIMLQDSDSVDGIKNGYFYEIIALSDNSIENYSNSNTQISNIIFYKVQSNDDSAIVNSVVVTKVGNTSSYLATYTYTPGDNLKKLSKDDIISISFSDTDIPSSLKTVSVDSFTIEESKNNKKETEFKFTVKFASLPSGVTVGTTYTMTDGVVSKQHKNGATVEVLWEGLTEVLVDDGLFTGQYRVTSEENPTVYDLAVEYIDNYTADDTDTTNDGRKFLLYFKNNLIGSVVDTNPLYKIGTAPTKMGLFVRGSSRVMFEKIYAISPNQDGSSMSPEDAPLSAFTDFQRESNDVFNLYKNPEPVSRSYLGTISPVKPPQNNIYYDEFGSIMREAAYFNVRYDKAYPALYATLAPTFNKLQGYKVSGFTAGAYGAEFLVFNTTDATLTLDEEYGNYLRILGIAFTQESNNQLTVDEYFDKNSDFSETEFTGQDLVLAKKDYQNIKNSRITYGLNEFNLDTPYIQSQDAANDLMGWMISKIMKPRKSVGIRIFPNPALQLGDIVSIDYNFDGVDQIIDPTSRFVVYNIEYTKSSSGPSMTVYLSEVV